MVLRMAGSLIAVSSVPSLARIGRDSSVTGPLVVLREEVMHVDGSYYLRWLVERDGDTAMAAGQFAYIHNIDQVRASMRAQCDVFFNAKRKGLIR